MWFIFSGMGTQWVGMGKVLMCLDVFARAIHKCAAVLSTEGVDLLNIINATDEAVFDNVLNSFVAITSVQVRLFQYIYNI